jgi:hypothetical protein
LKREVDILKRAKAISSMFNSVNQQNLKMTNKKVKTKQNKKEKERNPKTLDST